LPASSANNNQKNKKKKKKWNGSRALILWRTNKVTHLYRDVVGVCVHLSPIYYYHTAERFLLGTQTATIW
jgi:hypothetical protein